MINKKETTKAVKTILENPDVRIVSPSPIILRSLSLGDIPRLLEIEKEAWNKQQRASRAMLTARIETFPEGCFCAEKDNKIWGYAINQIVEFEKFSQSNITWYNITDNGFIRKSHTYQGDSLYGINISVSRVCSDKRVARKLYEYGARLSIKMNLKQILLGSRIPSFHKYADKMNVTEYVQTRTRTGRHIDPELDLYTKIGMKIDRVLPNYFSDPDSLDNGVLVKWINPFFPLTRHSSLLAKTLSNLFSI